MRPSNRAPAELRSIKITRHYTKHAEGSVLIECGDTRILCTASVDEKVPPFLRGKEQGWLTAEYGMLPRSTGERMQREAAKGKQSGRTMEIQRLIGRSLRSVMDLSKLGERTIQVDCDVIQADGGTRTASITGAFVAVHDAVETLLQRQMIETTPILAHVAAVSVGIYEGVPVLDLDYIEDSRCDTDMNVVMNGEFGLVEMQGTAEGVPFSRAGLGCDGGSGTAGNTGTDPDSENVPGEMRTGHMQKLVIASSNAGKLREIRHLLEPLGIEVLPQSQFKVSEVDEPHRTFIENAIVKARHACEQTGLPSLADDSGICVNALNGQPGVLSARYAGRTEIG